MAGLMYAARYAPTAAESISFRQGGSSGERVLENRYSTLADFYARRIDKNFDPRRGVHNDPHIVDKRMNFYAMINPLTAEQTDKGVKILLLQYPDKRLLE